MLAVFERVLFDGAYPATVIAAGGPGTTVKFDREAVARMDVRAIRYLKRTGGCLFVANDEADRLEAVE